MKVPSLAVALLLLISCTPEPTDEKIGLSTFKTAVSQPENPANPYDGAGALRNELLNTVLLTEPKSLSLQQLITRVDSVANSPTEFNAYRTASFTPLSALKLQSFLQNDATLAQVISGLPLSTSGKTALNGFLEGLFAITDGEFEPIYEYTVTFEQDVLQSGLYTAGDKEFILTLTSLERYAAYYRKKPKDKDWDLLITHIAAESEGTRYDLATAVLYSVGIESALHP